MGERLSQYQVGFNKSVRLEARPERITSEAGALLTREVLEGLGILRFLGEHLEDTRNPRLITHPLVEMVATSLLLMCQGWRDQDDADALRHDGALRLAVSTRLGVAALQAREQQDCQRDDAAKPCGLASQPTLSRMVKMLSTQRNQRVLKDALVRMAGERIRREQGGRRMQHMTIDVDSLPIPVGGHQSGSEYNGHYRERIFHPIVASVAETGDILDAELRPGNVHTALGASDFIFAVVDKAEQHICQVASVRMDAGFPGEQLLSGLEGRSIHYVARIKNNGKLGRMAEPHLEHAVLEMSCETSGTRMYECEYRASSWSRARRVVLVVQKRADELLTHHFWLVTSWSRTEYPPEDLLRHYRERGTAEGVMGELMNVLNPALSSTARPKSHYRDQVPQKRYLPGDCFAQNQVLMLLNLLAYETIHTLRQTMQKATRTGWSIKRTQERVLRVAARIVLHARRAVVVIEQRAADCWSPLLRHLRMLLGPAPAS